MGCKIEKEMLLTRKLVRDMLDKSILGEAEFDFELFERYEKLKEMLRNKEK